MSGRVFFKNKEPKFCIKRCNLRVNHSHFMYKKIYFKTYPFKDIRVDNNILINWLTGSTYTNNYILLFYLKGLPQWWNGNYFFYRINLSPPKKFNFIYFILFFIHILLYCIIFGAPLFKTVVRIRTTLLLKKTNLSSWKKRLSPCSVIILKFLQWTIGELCYSVFS